MRNFRKTVQKGFTLIELVVVVAIIGVLILLVVPNIAGSRDASVASLLLRTAQNAGDNWWLLNQECGTTTRIPDDNFTHPVTGEMGAEDVVFGGRRYTTEWGSICYERAKIRPLADAGQSLGDSSWAVGNYGVSFSGGVSSPIYVTYFNVPDNIVRIMAQKYNPTLSALNDEGSSEGGGDYGVLQYDGSSPSESRNVTVVRYTN